MARRIAHGVLWEGRSLIDDAPIVAIATAEHLRALAELRDTGGCTNWFVVEPLTGAAHDSAEEVDWSGFVAPDPEQ